MRDGMLFQWTQLRKGFAEWRVMEVRVITESTAAARTLEDHAVRPALCHLENATPLCKRNHADVVSRAALSRHSLKFSKQPGIIRGVRTRSEVIALTTACACRG